MEQSEQKFPFIWDFSNRLVPKFQDNKNKTRYRPRSLECDSGSGAFLDDYYASWQQHQNRASLFPALMDS
jgi:hypothetical protein